MTVRRWCGVAALAALTGLLVGTGCAADVDPRDVQRAEAATTRVAGEALDALGVDQDTVASPTVSTRACTDAFGLRDGRVSASWVTDDPNLRGVVTVDDIEQLPAKLGWSDLRTAVLDNVVDQVTETTYYLNTVSDDFEVSVDVVLDTNGAFTLVTQAHCR